MKTLSKVFLREICVFLQYFCENLLSADSQNIYISQKLVSYNAREQFQGSYGSLKFVNLRIFLLLLLFF